MRRNLIIAGGLILLAGCATVAPLRTEATTSAIRAAQEAGAQSVPDAALHLKLAQEELDQARTLALKGDGERGASMLTRAEADAELARLLAYENYEKTTALAALERVRKLREANQLPASPARPNQERTTP